jgi:hypothetical protein
MRLGKLEKQAYDFIKSIPGQWHSFYPNSENKRVMNSLVKKGLIEINQFNQFKLKEKPTFEEDVKTAQQMNNLVNGWNE